MGLDGAPGHLELLSDFCVVTALQQQIGDLLLAWAEPNRRFLHRFPRKSIDLPPRHTVSLPVREFFATPKPALKTKVLGLSL
jgi:hypothetical protein